MFNQYKKEFNQDLFIIIIKAIIDPKILKGKYKEFLKKFLN